MQYYSKKDLDKILDVRDRRTIQLTLTPIEITFCRGCKFFERDYYQSDPDVETGWCRGRSYHLVYDNERPYYVETNSESFCDKRTVMNFDQFIFGFGNCYISYVV